MKQDKKVIHSLIAFIIMITIAIILIVLGVILDRIGATNFVKSDAIPKYKSPFYIYLLEIGGAVLFLLSFGNLHFYLQNKYNIKKMNIKQMAIIAVFSALSVILYYFAKFNIPIFPSWLDIQFSDVPALLVGFMYGPFSGALTIVIRFFCKLPGTQTVGVGELADLLIGLTLVLTSAFFYKKHRTLKGALISMLIGMASATVVATLSNWVLLIPAYKFIAGYPQAALTGAMDTILGGRGIVNDNNFMFYYLFIAVIPFNILRYIMVFTVTFILYKRLQMLIIRFAGNYKDQMIEYENEKE